MTKHAGAQNERSQFMLMKSQIEPPEIPSIAGRLLVQTMPLTAPGSLKPDEYAAVMAYLLSYDCVQPAGGGQQQFPTEEPPDLQHVKLGSATCAPK
jgi:hypothetical protein